MNKSTHNIENIKYSIKNFPNYFFDGDLNLYYSKDKINFRPKKAYISKRSLGFKLHKKFRNYKGFGGNIRTLMKRMFQRGFLRILSAKICAFKEICVVRVPFFEVRQIVNNSEK